MISLADTFEKMDNVRNFMETRKTREVCWKEARLSIVHSKGSVSPVYGSILGDEFARYTIRACMSQHSKVRCVSDVAFYGFIAQLMGYLALKQILLSTSIILIIIFLQLPRVVILIFLLFARKHRKKVERE